MDIHTTCWTPMTCACQIHYRWDKHEGHETRRHAFHRFEKKCAVHTKMTDDQAWSDIIKANPSSSWGHVPDLTCSHCITAHRGK